MDFDAATKKALGFTHPDHIERVWVDGTPGFKSIKHEGCFILHDSGISQLAGENGSKLPESKIQHRSTLFGELWIEQYIEQEHLSQTLFFSPRGLPGFLYWYLLYPFHWLRLRGLIHKGMKQS